MFINYLKSNRWVKEYICLFITNENMKLHFSFHNILYHSMMSVSTNVDFPSQSSPIPTPHLHLHLHLIDSPK